MFARQPIGTVTTDQLAAGAGLSRSSFYFYFSSKQAVLAALMQNLAEDLAEGHQRWLTGTGRDDDAQREACRHVARVWREHGPLLEQTWPGAARAGRDAEGAAPDTTEAHADYAAVVAELDASRARFINRLAARITRERSAGLAPGGIPARQLALMVESLRTARFAELRGRSDARGDAAAVADVVRATNLLLYGLLD